MATPTASGVAISKAIADETTVPKIAGAAPKWPWTASHSLEVRNPNPAALNAGQPALKMAMAMAPSMTGIDSAAAAVPHL